MSYNFNITCRKCSLIVVFMLLLQVSFAQYNFSKVDAWLGQNVKELGGRAVIVVYKDGKVVYDNAANNLGWRQKMVGKFLAKRQGRPATDEALKFSDTSKAPIASCSKWLSAALVMSFVDEGKLNLEDTIGKYLPVMNKYGKGGIKVKYCLSHLTGIKSGSLKESRDLINNAASMEEAINNIARASMDGEPGKTFHYSSAGLQIAAAIIEKIGAKDFNTLFKERIAKPCKMLNTDFGDGKVPLAAGSALSTPLDYLNFLEMILNNGIFNGKQVLSKESIAAMQINRISQDVVIAYTPPGAEDWGYGYGEWTMDATYNTISNAVSSPGLFGSFPWVDKQKNYAAFLFTVNINYKGRKEKYTELKGLVDEVFSQ
ncbi:serine hydrolase domain-containing protein [Ferruginibacter albus]|uniref:serine hydrolase domain-containing protein n=1 Tax=Ferruginibacter albus TaxID=2875540 RepID=UPI001CC7256C|nr:serine hydrolase domain-containing protein [Ferruginibacter albus]UAY51433.1 beta-lactamase family protein [Ferruginibacter albus]